MPEFFVPGTGNPAQAERRLAEIIKHCEERTGLKVGKTRIYRLEFIHNRERSVGEVGEPLYYGNGVGRTVIAILDADPFLVCTSNRGAVKGNPYRIDRRDVRLVVPFDPPGAWDSGSVKVYELGPKSRKYWLDKIPQKARQSGPVFVYKDGKLVKVIPPILKGKERGH